MKEIFPIQTPQGDKVEKEKRQIDHQKIPEPSSALSEMEYKVRYSLPKNTPPKGQIDWKEPQTR
jgi:hypothetical protein